MYIFRIQYLVEFWLRLLWQPRQIGLGLNILGPTQIGASFIMSSPAFNFLVATMNLNKKLII